MPGLAPARDAIERVAFDGARVELDPVALERVAGGRRATLAALADAGPVYGVGTGQGYLAARELHEEEADRHQRELLLGRAVGSAPWLERGEARAVLAVRLARFLDGRAGVSRELCAFLAARLDDGFTPAIPRTSVGCAGEIIPLAHAFQTLMGVGRVLGADGVEDAGAALAARGVAPYEPGPKEGIALLAGSPATTALALARRRTGAPLAGALAAGAACAIDAARAPLGPYEAGVGRLANDRLLEGVLDRLRRLLGGSDPERRPGQAPASFRVAPQVLAHLGRALVRLGEDLDRALGACDDSPALVDGRFLSTGAFHEIELAAAMDAVAAALARAGELAVQRVHRLLDSRVTGLPDQLTPAPGPRCGLVALHKRAAGAAAELRRLAIPASIGIGDTSLGQEDAQTFGLQAAEELRRAEGLTREILAIELIAARQAWFLRDRPPAAGLAAIAARLEATVAPVERDRPLGPDVDAVVGRFDTLFHVSSAEE
jgi:histidine ammonia-lyase